MTVKKRTLVKIGAVAGALALAFMLWSLSSRAIYMLDELEYELGQTVDGGLLRTQDGGSQIELTAEQAVHAFELVRYLIVEEAMTLTETFTEGYSSGLTGIEFYNEGQWLCSVEVRQDSEDIFSVILHRTSGQRRIITGSTSESLVQLIEFIASFE